MDLFLKFWINEIISLEKKEVTKQDRHFSRNQISNLELNLAEPTSNSQFDQRGQMNSSIAFNYPFNLICVIADI